MSQPNDASPIPPLAECLPSSARILAGELQVPEREIALTNGERVRVYDTTGPQGHDPRRGLPKMRAPWIEARVSTNEELAFSSSKLSSPRTQLMTLLRSLVPEPLDRAVMVPVAAPCALPSV